MSEATARVSCPHGDECGACALLGVAVRDQLQRKTENLARALGKYSGLRRIRPLPCLPSPQAEGYRNRAKMAVGMSRHEPTRLGYFRGGTREIVSAPDCRVLIPELLQTTRGIRRFLESSRKVPRELRHIDLRCGTDPSRQHLTLVFRATDRPAFPLEDLKKRCPAVDGISFNLNPSSGPQVIRGSVKHWWGEREVWVEHAGLQLRISPPSFCQVNLALLPAIHQRMERFFESGQVLADLYAGVGTHGLALRGRFSHVLFAEGSRPAVADLKATIRSHAIADTSISPVAVERGLDALRKAAPDAVVLNPSRAGASQEVLDAVGRTPAAKLAYLACDPATLCRDLDLLRGHGFAIRSVEPIDMMPQTRQVEALALLTRN